MLDAKNVSMNKVLRAIYNATASIATIIILLVIATGKRPQISGGLLNSERKMTILVQNGAHALAALILV